MYFYFKSKEDLLFLIQRHCFDTLLERLTEDLEGVDEPVDRLEVIVWNHLRFFADNMSEMKALSRGGGPDRRQIAARKREYVSAVQACVDQVAPDRDPADRRVATFALFGMMNWIYTWYRPGKDVSVDRLSSTILQIFLGGVGTPHPVESHADRRAPDGGKTSMWMEQ